MGEAIAYPGYFVALYLAVSRVLSTVEVFTAEAERILVSRLARGEATAPHTRVLVPETMLPSKKNIVFIKIFDYLFS